MKVEYKSELAAGFDLPSAEDRVILPNEKAIISTGLTFQELAGAQMPQMGRAYLELQIRPRSGLSFKHDLIFFNTIGTIDADYTGIISVKLWNTGDKPFPILIGDRIAQGVFAYVTRPAHIPVSDHIRGTGGFGSTGRGD